MNKICRDFMEKKCNRQNCHFIHDRNVCYHFWKFGKCKFGDNCRKKHNIEKHKKNTETFEPNYNPPDMRVVMEFGKQKSELDLKVRDVVLIPDLFIQNKENEIYEKLVNELDKCGNVLKLWHGDTHLIADDKLNWKEKCPTFMMVIDKIRDYFGMDIKATRFNWYGSDQHKPFHFDAAGVNPEKAKTQNFTVGVSFGYTREIAFEEVDGKKVVSFPCPDGFVYAFCREMNTKWRHGIPAVKVEDGVNGGRISVIAWGWKEQKEL